MSLAMTDSPQESLPKDRVQILPGATDNLSAATYCIYGEDHTLGNILRWMLMKNPDVEFCGYSAPHPSEDKIHVRIQMYDNKSSLTAIHSAIDNLESMTLAIQSAYASSLSAGDYARVEDDKYDFESVNERLWQEKEERGEGTREEFERERREREEKEEKERTKGKGKKVKAGR